MPVTKKLVEDFISKYNNKFSTDLENDEAYTTVVRLASLNRALQNIKTYFKTVIVVSGSEQERDLRIINFDNLYVLNYEDDWRDTMVKLEDKKIIKNKLDKKFKRKWDLDKSWKDFEVPQCDLVICNQVFEHIFNPHQAIKNIIQLVKKGGYIFISVPSINCIHGEPHYYSSGYHPRYLQRLGDENNLKTIYSDYWGSIKFMLHKCAGRWRSYRDLAPGIHDKSDLRFPSFIFVDGRIHNVTNSLILKLQKYHLDLPYPTHIIDDCWILFQKNY